MTLPRSGSPKPSSRVTLPDYLAHDLLIVFVGINPGLRSAEVGHHFAGYSNRFWKLLNEAHLVPIPVTCHDDWRLPEWRYGLTNVVGRPTTGVKDLTARDYDRGRTTLLARINRYQPRIVALLGITVWNQLFPGESSQTTRQRGHPGVRRVGLQRRRVGSSKIFVLPNPSGRNAHYSYQEMLSLFCELRRLSGNGLIP